MIKKTRFWRGMASLLSALLILTMSMTSLLFDWEGQVNIALNVTIPKVEADVSTLYYPGDYELSDTGLEAMLIDSDAHDIQTLVEGSVLLKNDNNALPLNDNERSITLFGRSVADPVYRGNSGGPMVDIDRQVSLYDALKNDGFSINDQLFNAYQSSDVVRQKASPDWFIGEVSKDFYTQELMNSFASDYNDVAIVMFSRDGGEGKDLAQSDRDGISYLALHDTEKQLLDLIESSGKFSKTIVLINSAYPMELDWVNDSTYGIDAALWIGTPGLVGFQGVSNLLVGNADPSGHFVDTFAADSLSSAAVQNAGSFTFENDSANYVVQAEGIYLGYKYYETRYQDSVLNINNANSSTGAFVDQTAWNYGKEMVYPFGFGLSYANFSQTLDSLEWNQDTHQVTATVTVTNEGYPDGSLYDKGSKATVQLYVQLPYESGQAQKSAIQLLDFGKTGFLNVGESETVTIQVDDYLFATYDQNAVNGADVSKIGSYVFDPGDYYFAIGKDSHDALNNVMALKYGETVTNLLINPEGETVTGNLEQVAMVHQEKLDNITHAKSLITGEIVSNQFDNIDINYFSENTVNYLNRDDWNTFPTPYQGLTMTSEMKEIIEDESYESPTSGAAYDDFVQGVDSGLYFLDMKDVPYEDTETWEKFINQLSIAEMTSIVGENFGQPAVKSVNKPVNKNSDGPSGSQSNYLYGSNAPSTVHPSEVVATSTWNKAIISDRGKFISNDCLFSGTTQLWSPGANLHRTPFSGRNFEYYSEDSIMSYLMSSTQTAAMQKNGLNASIKHFVANDQETNRTGLVVFMTEQTYRQGSLKGFEGAFTKGNALGTMLAFNRIGLTKLYQDERTLTQVLRNEWGFKGVTITDSVKGDSEVKTIASLVAGVDTFNADSNRGSEIQKYLVANKEGYVLEKLREANKHFYFAMVNSNLINGLANDIEVSDFVPWWKDVLKGLIVVLSILFIVSLVILVIAFRRNKRERSL